MFHRSSGPGVSVLLASMLVFGAGLPTLAVDEDGAPPADPLPAIRIEPGGALKVAGLNVADQWLVITDSRGDWVRQDETRAPGADAKIEVVETWIALGDASKKLVKAIDSGKLRFGRPGNWRGADFKLKKGDPAVFTVIRTARKATKKTARFAQAVVMFDGDRAFPASAGPDAGIFTGHEVISMGGGFGTGGWLSGDTTLKDHVPGGEISLFNAKARGAGGIDKKAGALVHIVPVPKGAETMSVALRLEDGDLYDVVDLPGGGTHIGFSDGAWGVNLARADAPAPLPYHCQRSELVERELAEQTGNGTPVPERVWRTYFGLIEPGDEVVATSDELAAYEATMSVELAPVGSDGESTIVEGKVELLRGLNGARVSAVVPDGQWIPSLSRSFSGDVPDPRLAGLIAHRDLYGGAGFAADPGVTGHLAGDEHCVAWNVPGTTCDMLPTQALADAMGIEEELATGSQFLDDGTLGCFGIDLTTNQAAYVAGVGKDYYSTTMLHADAERHRCPHTKAALGIDGVLFDCTPEGFKSYPWLLQPDTMLLPDTIGGFRVSLDINLAAVAPGATFEEAVIVTALAPWVTTMEMVIVPYPEPGF